MIVAIGTNDSLASPGAQLDYYQAVARYDGARHRSTRSRASTCYLRPVTD